MPGHKETNVRLPLCALSALTTVAARRGVSRDEAVRRLLDEHITRQHNREPRARLTHIATVLKYPATPLWRGEPTTARPLRLRLVPGTVERAREVALRLPGQHPRGHHDYQARLLTDAMLTAIAVEEPFSDEFLDGLTPLLRHASAVGLWHLAAAATSTAPERAVHEAAQELLYPSDAYDGPSLPSDPATRERLLRVARALDEEVSWHSSARFRVAANLARELLRGPDAGAHEQMLYDQDKDGRWGDLRSDLCFGAENLEPYMQGVTSWDWSGRGGAAVWRAERRVELQDFEHWLLTPHAGADAGTELVEHLVKPPGWPIRLPRGWRALPGTTTQIPERFARWVAQGRLLAFPIDDTPMLWPLQGAPDTPGEWTPVPGIEPLVHAAQRLGPQRISGFVEAMLVDWNPDSILEHHPHAVLRLPADRALGFGLIDSDRLREARLEAREVNQAAMTAIIDMVAEEALREYLQEVRNKPVLFKKAADQLPGVTFTAVAATWTWPGRSVADEVLAGTDAAIVRWLAGWAHRTCNRVLQQSMEQSWRDAFQHHPADFWRPTSACDTEDYN
ncbi:ribbon-helix-helix domain-containing protein (plasmid) [Embleya sp. NBC_00888]|uniref:CopG family transcriptional regulator n=1 Tax=Embleya sp. NBC_00888 TaxID=2975960 RepID=UPI002F918A97|nr:ribbon-helix-helix domain-containing protein [Embleya sp. NBC_00888]